jgi:hypothetical protein
MPPAHPGLAPGQRVLQPGGSPRASETSDPDGSGPERALERPAWQTTPEVAFPAGTKAGQSAHPFGLDDAFPVAKSAPKLTLAPPEHPSAPDSAVLRPAGSRMSDVATQLPGSAPPAPRFRAAPRSEPNLEAGPLSTAAAAGSSGPSVPASPFARTTTSAGSAARAEVATLDLARRGLATLSEGVGRAPEGLGGSSMLDTEMPSGGASRPPWTEPASDYYPQPSRSAGGGSLGPAPMGASGASAGTGPTRGKGGGTVEAAARAQSAVSPARSASALAWSHYEEVRARVEPALAALPAQLGYSSQEAARIKAEYEGEIQAALDAAMQAGATVGAAEDAAEEATDLVSAQNPGQGQKRIDEERARQSSEAYQDRAGRDAALAAHRAHRGQVQADRQAGRAAASQRREAAQQIAANAGSVVGKFVALAIGARAVKVTTTARSRALASFDSRQASLESRHREGSKGVLGPLSREERRELAQLRSDGARRRREQRELDRAAQRADRLEARRHAHVMRHGPAIERGMKRAAARLDREAKIAAAKAKATPSEGKRKRLEARAAQLAAEATALRTAAAQVSAEHAGATVPVLYHFTQHIVVPNLAAWSGRGCPPDASVRCCPACPVGTVCECKSTDGSGGPGGGGSDENAGAAEERAPEGSPPSRTVSLPRREPEVEVEVEVEETAFAKRAELRKRLEAEPEDTSDPRGPCRDQLSPSEWQRIENEIHAATNQAIQTRDAVGRAAAEGGFSGGRLSRLKEVIEIAADHGAGQLLRLKLAQDEIGDESECEESLQAVLAGLDGLQRDVALVAGVTDAVAAVMAA